MKTTSHEQSSGAENIHPFSKACLKHSQTVFQPSTWFMEGPSLFSTAQSLTCSIMEKPHTGLDDCLENAAGML